MGKARKMFNHKLRGLKITKLMARDGECCMLCGQKLDRHIKDPNHDEYITFDHIDPESNGGWDDLSNLQLAHHRCNQKRGSKPLPLPT